jgi:hypothetical protein
VLVAASRSSEHSNLRSSAAQIQIQNHRPRPRISGIPLNFETVSNAKIASKPVLSTTNSMEALGAISSILSLLVVVIRSSNAIHSLMSNWRDVPIEIIALTSEVNDSKAVSNQACHLLQQIKDIPPKQTLGPAHSLVLDIERQINQASPIWNELQDALSKLDGREDETIKCSKSNRLRWLKYRRKIDRMKRDLRER